MQEYLFKHFNSMGHNVFLKNVSITLTDMTDCNSLKGEKTNGEEL